MLYNKGNHAQLKRVQPQPSRLQGENGGKIYSTWNPGFIFSPAREKKAIKTFGAASDAWGSSVVWAGSGSVAVAGDVAVTWGVSDGSPVWLGTTSVGVDCSA